MLCCSLHSTTSEDRSISISLAVMTDFFFVVFFRQFFIVEVYCQIKRRYIFFKLISFTPPWNDDDDDDDIAVVNTISTCIVQFQRIFSSRDSKLTRMQIFDHCVWSRSSRSSYSQPTSTFCSSCWRLLANELQKNKNCRQCFRIQFGSANPSHRNVNAAECTISSEISEQ